MEEQEGEEGDALEECDQVVAYGGVEAAIPLFDDQCVKEAVPREPQQVAQLEHQKNHGESAVLSPERSAAVGGLAWAGLVAALSHRRALHSGPARCSADLGDQEKVDGGHEDKHDQKAVADGPSERFNV